MSVPLAAAAIRPDLQYAWYGPALLGPPTWLGVKPSYQFCKAA